MAATCRLGADGLRNCFRDPIPEISEAAVLLKHAVLAHQSGQRPLAESLIRAADMPVLGEWIDPIWLGGRNNPHRSIRSVENLPPVVPKLRRHEPRNPGVEMKRSLIGRDGHHCRVCGIPVVRAEVRKEPTKLYPDAARWTGVKEGQQHRGLQVTWLQYDHVLVHSRGGETSMDNIIVTCAARNFGRDRWMMSEVGIRDPRDYPRTPAWPGWQEWDGLESTLPEKEQFLRSH